MEEIKPKGNASDHLANERTYLAWLRTGIGIMAFGFVVVKFSLFVKQISLVLEKPAKVPNKGYSAILGIFLVVVGAAASILAYARFKKIERQLTTGLYINSSVLVTVITVLVFLVSIFLIAYLIQTT